VPTYVLRVETPAVATPLPIETTAADLRVEEPNKSPNTDWTVVKKHPHDHPKEASNNAPDDTHHSMHTPRLNPKYSNIAFHSPPEQLPGTGTFIW
jgi:hypothetical protein